MKKFDAIVIGSGLAGMSCALLLARRGKKVALAEQGSQLAPLIAGFDRQGAHFETGLHYSSHLGENEVGQAFFKKLGLTVPVQPCISNGFDEIRLLTTGRSFKMAYGREQALENFAAAFPREIDAVRRYLELMRQEAKRSAFLNLLEPGTTYDDFFTPRHGRTLQEVLDDLFASPELKAILSASTYLYGTPPSRTSFVQHSCIVSGMCDSMWEIVGGGRSLLASYRQALEQAGVEILLQHRATRLEIGEKQKHLHFANGSSLACDLCISSVYPPEFLRIAPPHVYRANHVERLKLIPETGGFFSLYAVNTEQQPRPQNNIFLLPELDFKKMSPEGSSLPFYVNFSHDTPQTVCAIAVLPQDHALTERGGTDYRTLKANTAEQLREQLRRYAPDVVKGLEFIAGASPATQKKYVGYSGGYGLMHDVNHTNILPITKIPGIYLAGQSVVAPGLIGSIISAFLLDKIWDKQGI